MIKSCITGLAVNVVVKLAEAEGRGSLARGAGDLAVHAMRRHIEKAICVQSLLVDGERGWLLNWLCSYN